MMKKKINKFLKNYRHFEDWFNTRFAWFFTNGMKEIRDYSRSDPEQLAVVTKV